MLSKSASQNTNTLEATRRTNSTSAPVCRRNTRTGRVCPKHSSAMARGRFSMMFAISAQPSLGHWASVIRVPLKYNSGSAGAAWELLGMVAKSVMPSARKSTRRTEGRAPSSTRAGAPSSVTGTNSTRFQSVPADEHGAFALHCAIRDRGSIVFRVQRETFLQCVGAAVNPDCGCVVYVTCFQPSYRVARSRETRKRCIGCARTLIVSTRCDVKLGLQINSAHFRGSVKAT